ncbi:MAG: glycosyltransferase family 2 protein [Tateyamaria sp.]
MPSLTDIQIVTVAYNSTGVIGDMLASIPEGVQVVIVDNASTDADALASLAAQHGATVVTNPENKGFGAACNIGAAHCGRPWLLFLNPDARLEPGCLDTLCHAADAHPTACAFTPRVLDGKGKQAFRRRSRLLPKSKHWAGPAPQSDTEVPLLNGAAIFVQASNFNSVGGFDDCIFLYHEDDDLSLRLSAAHGPIRFVHDAVVTHAEGRSTARTPATAAFKARHMAQSAIYAMEKHGQSGARARIVTHGLMQLASPLNFLSARKRAKALGFLKGALSNGIAPHS